MMDMHLFIIGAFNSVRVDSDRLFVVYAVRSGVVVQAEWCSELLTPLHVQRVHAQPCNLSLGNARERDCPASGHSYTLPTIL